MIIFLSFYLIFINIIGYNNFKNIDTLINPIIFLILFIITLFLNSKERIKYKKEKEQNVLIIVLIYLTIYFLSGLYFGYNKNNYDNSFIGIITNLWSYIFIIIYEEYIRNFLVKKNKILTILIFTLFEINIYTLLNINNNIDLFKQISLIVIPAISTNLLLNYLTKTSGFISCLLYKIPIIFTNIFLPIIPNLDWFINSIIRTILPFIIYLFIRKIDTKKDRVKPKTTSNILLIIILLIVICFIAELFKYKIVSIASNSMKDSISRGDAVVVEETKNIDLYDIIEFKADKIIIVHRVIGIEKHNDGTILYITKGDNNNIADKDKIKEDQIIGKVLFKIPYIGYPSIWLNEIFTK